jgi:hypothetical protein
MNISLWEHHQPEREKVNGNLNKSLLLYKVWSESTKLMSLVIIMGS